MALWDDCPCLSLPFRGGAEEKRGAPRGEGRGLLEESDSHAWAIASHGASDNASGAVGLEGRVGGMRFMRCVMVPRNMDGRQVMEAGA